MLTDRIIRGAALLASAALLAACAVSPAPRESESPSPAEAIPEIPDPPATVLPPPPAEPEILREDLRLSIAAVGDMMLGTDFPENHLPDDDGVSFLHEVTPILSRADIAFGNLEGVLMDGGEPRKKCSNPKACYLFRSPSRYADYLRDAGFDVMSLANNHARDFGEEGRSASMQHLAERGLRHSGREGDIARWSQNGLSIAFIAFAVTRESNMMLDLELAQSTVAALARENDIVVVSFHGGAEGFDAVTIPFAEEEYYGEPRGDVVKFSHMMVDAGADLVLGHGPHVVRALEHYNGRLIAYSLGNFATYYGISVAGIKGLAPILVTTLDGNGRFIEATVHSTRQIRPAGPSMDPEQRVYTLMRDLSFQDFGNPGLQFLGSGVIRPLPASESGVINTSPGSD